MADDAPMKASWDRKLTERLARESWEAANVPSRCLGNPSFRAQIRSPYYWLAALTFGAAVLILLAAGDGWPRTIVWGLYVLSSIANAFARRDARAARLRAVTTNEK